MEVSRRHTSALWFNALVNSVHWKKNLIHVNLKSWVTGGTKFDPGFRVIEEYLSFYHLELYSIIYKSTYLLINYVMICWLVFLWKAYSASNFKIEFTNIELSCVLKDSDTAKTYKTFK